MSVRTDARCKVVCWDQGSGGTGKLLPPYDRDLQAIDLVHTSNLDQTQKELGRSGEAILLLAGFSQAAAELARSLRADPAWSSLPIFAAVSGGKMDADMQQVATAQAIELLPMPIPAGRFWSRLREAGNKYRVKAFRTSSNRRRYYRVPLAVSAHCLVEAMTIDIGVGGIQFQTNHAYAVGGRGRLDIPWLHETMGEALAFQVVSVEALPRGEFRYFVHAQFLDLDPEARKKLGRALAVVEPGAWSPE